MHITGESKGKIVSMKRNVKAQTNLNREGLVVTKTKTFGVETCPEKQKLSGQLALTMRKNAIYCVDIQRSCIINIE